MQKSQPNITLKFQSPIPNEKVVKANIRDADHGFTQARRHNDHTISHRSSQAT
ncbi:hypothetical protein [Shewanella woodyi]|uniref:hypothetical protein n=1 Tax=Shewanella woodyi TaxID=60961 RepID=UPI0012F847CD|nr:hypothetical protein [Shewanella woodyi]